MLELADEADSKSVGLITRAGSTPATGTSVRRSKHRSVSALRRKLHYVSSFFLLNCDPLCRARSLVFMFRCISIQNLSQNTESDQQMVLFFLSKSNLLRLALIWGLRSTASLSRIEAVLRLRLRQYANSRPDSGAGIILFFFESWLYGRGVPQYSQNFPVFEPPQSGQIHSTEAAGVGIFCTLFAVGAA